MEKKKRDNKPPNPSEKTFLKNLYGILLKPLQEEPEALKKFAGECDLEHSNLCRYIRESPNAQIITLKRLCEQRDKTLWEIIKQAEEMKDNPPV